MKQMALLLFIITYFCIACNTENTNQKKSDLPAYTQYLLQQVEKNSDSVGLRLQLIYSLDSAGLYTLALQQMDSLITKDSLNYALWFNKGHLQENAKDTAGAILSYKRAIRVYAAPEALLSLANLYAETKNDTALSLCKAVELTTPDRKYTADCKFITGVYYSRINKTDSALYYFDNCINNSYTYIVAYLEKGFIYYDSKNYKEALNIFKLAAEVNNTYADAYYWQAKCYEAMGDKTNAIAYYKKSLVLDKNLKEAQEAINRLQ